MPLSTTATAPARHNLFKVLLPETVPNPADEGHSALIVHKTICRACREVVAERRHTSKGTAYRESMQAEANMEADTMDCCEHCSAINLSAVPANFVPSVAEPVASATELS